MNIVVLCGGLSNERDVSVTSGKMAANALKELGHNIALIDLFFGYDGPIDSPEDIFSGQIQIEDVQIGEDAPDLDAIMAMREGGHGRIGHNVMEICAAADIVFLALHGEDGEDGKIQAALDLAGIKYTGSGSFASGLAMNKGVAKEVFSQNGILTPAGIILSKNEKPYKSIGFPCVVKPMSGGSSVGTSVVNSEEEYEAALKTAFQYEDNVIVEQYIKGRECDVGVIGGKALPVIEICPKSGFFDYKNKYQSGMTDEYCPADLSDMLTQRLQDAALDVFRALRLDVYARMDFIVDEFDRIWCLEANTLPGITPESLMPKEAAAAGMSYGDFCELIITESLKKYEK